MASLKLRGMTTLTMKNEGTEALGRHVALGVLGTAAFGVAAAAGHGAVAMAKGAWMGPALFVGGAALAAPPLYMFGALAGSRQTARATAERCGKSLAAVGTALMGLAAPAAYLSATLTTKSAPALLGLCCVALGTAGVVAVARASLQVERKEKARTAVILWSLFALALGVRLMVAIGKAGWS